MHIRIVPAVDPTQTDLHHVYEFTVRLNAFLYQKEQYALLLTAPFDDPRKQVERLMAASRASEIARHDLLSACEKHGRVVAELAKGGL